MGMPLNQGKISIVELLVTAGLAAATRGAKPGAKVHLMIQGDPPPETYMFIKQEPVEDGRQSIYVREIARVQRWVDKGGRSFYIAYSPACNQVGVFVPGLIDLVGDPWRGLERGIT